MRFSDTPLKPVLEMMEKQATTLSKARAAFLLRESERKHFESNLIKKAIGKSHAERVNEAQSSLEWLAFHRDLARLEAVFEHERLIWFILDREWLAQHQSLKLDNDTIKRSV